jgi:glutamyl-Q tRNA(Asp) synthetase
VLPLLTLLAGMTRSDYRGRFAPSPTGNLHIGSLIAAVGSFLAARSQQGEWWVRIEDIDPPREIPGSAERILRALEAFGFEWEILSYQHDRLEYYEAALETLRKSGLLYPCDCSRKTLTEVAGSIYPGTCRNRSIPAHGRFAWRLRTDNARIRFDDGLQGSIEYDLPVQCGDFVLKRADSYYAYQLAVAVDDALQDITDVVRGVDLLDSTPRQIYIQQLLGLASPRYTHLPVLVNTLGQKLSKQTFATPLNLSDPVPQLWLALRVLGQQPPGELQHSEVAGLWDWAIRHWNPANLPSQREICLDGSTSLADKNSHTG